MTDNLATYTSPICVSAFRQRITSDNESHKFKVTGIRSGLIEGNATSIPVDQVVSVQKREFSTGKTVVLIAGIVLVIGGLVAIAAANSAPAFALSHSEP